MKNIIILIGLVAVIIIAVVFIRSNDVAETISTESTPAEVVTKSDVAETVTMVDGKSEQAMVKAEPTTVTPTVSTPAVKVAGTYEAYSVEKIAQAATGPVVLFFRAAWCPTCRNLDKDIRANLNNIPANVTILDVNYDTETALKQKYGVTYQHTLVQVDATGNLITKWSSSPTLSALVGKIQ